MIVTTQVAIGRGGPNAGDGEPGAGAAPIPGPITYAGLVTRAIAIVIDTLLIDAAALAAAGAVGLLKSLFEPSYRQLPHGGDCFRRGALSFFVWVAAYFVTFWTTTGRRPAVG